MTTEGIFSGYTDFDNAYRFINNSGDYIRYVPAWERWMVWDGKRWQKDESGQVIQLWQQSATELHEMSQQHKSRKMQQHAERSANRGGIEAMLRLAETDPRVITSPAEWDTNHWLLNVRNGLIDLRTGEMVSHSSEHLITKLADIVYDETAQCPRFEQFLNEVFDNNQAVIEFVQRVFGVCLTGITRDHSVYILHGLGANGKSTLLTVLASLLGEFHKTAAPAAFFDDKSGLNSNAALATLHGARAVTCTEPNRREALQEAVIKRISGSDPVSARFLHGQFFEFQPTFKVLLAVNHKPEVKGAERGLWRRLKMIPFDVSFEGREDYDLIDKLLVEMPGILNWAVRGCLAWQEQGLNQPAEIMSATREYREEMDDLGPWLDACCVVGNQERIETTSLFTSYKDWCEAEGDKPVARQWFGRMLSERGFGNDRTKRSRYRLGIRLKTAEELASPEESLESDWLKPVQSEFLEEPPEPEND